MGILELIFRGKHKAEEESELKKSLAGRVSEEDAGRKALLLEDINVKEPKMYSPAVEHPLLTIQDRISKLEDIYRSLNGKLSEMNTKIATKQDIKEVKALVSQDILNGEQVIAGIDSLGSRLEKLRTAREVLTRQVDETTRQLTRKAETLSKVDKEISLLECDQNILNALGGGDKSTIELAKELSLTRQYIWGRLKELQAAGYVKSIKKGRKTKYHLVKFT